MSDDCLLELAKSGELLQDRALLVNFLEPWYDTAKHAEEVLMCMQKTSSHSEYPELPSKVYRETIHKAARASTTIK